MRLNLAVLTLVLVSKVGQCTVFSISIVWTTAWDLRHPNFLTSYKMLVL